MKYIFILFFAIIILLITNIDAIYPGECDTEFFDGDVLFFEVTSNTSEIVNYFSWTKLNDSISYCFASDTPPGDYSFRWSNKARVIEKEVRVGGGGGGIRTIIKNQTQYVEVPTYINNTIEKEVPTLSNPQIVNNISIVFLIVIGMLFIIIIFLTWYVLKHRAERRFTKNE